ncbi:MAG: hypothetical protein VYA27_08570 [Verrucomicrobiota bacterium]|nr:hypothetical protein [Verrucomicrobiota bacterium]
MSAKVTLLLVAAGSFSIGMALDHFLFSSSGATEREGTTEALTLARKSSSDRNRSGESTRENPDGNPEEQRNPEGENNVLRNLIENLEQGRPANFAAAARTILAMPHGPRRREALHRRASRWGRSDPTAALRWSESLTGRDRFSTMEDILRHWSEEDPASAADYVAQLPGSEHSLHLLRDLSHRWAETDRSAALEWSMALDDPALRMRALRGVASSWAEHDPAEAAAFTTDSLESPDERRHVLEAVARRWAERDLQEALEWARDLEPGDQQRATRAVLRTVAEHNPSEAATLYHEIANDLPAAGPINREYRHMAQEVASVWSSSSPAEAAQWALTLPERGAIRRGAVGDVTEQWMRIDSMAAGEWVKSLPPGNTRDGASERVVHMTAHTDPGSAFAWAQSIGEDHRRFGLMHHTLTPWSNVDRPAAQQALSTADIPPEVRQRFGEELGLTPAPPPSPSNGGQPDTE